MPKETSLDYYALVRRIRPSRAPSIFHQEYKYYWGEFPQPPVYSIYNTTFYNITPLAHTVDCRNCGQLHYWARVGRAFCPALVVFHFTEAKAVREIRCYFYGGLVIERSEWRSMAKVENPDLELFHYALAGFLQEYLSRFYQFNK